MGCVFFLFVRLVSVRSTDFIGHTRDRGFGGTVVRLGFMFGGRCVG